MSLVLEALPLGSTDILGGSPKASLTEVLDIPGLAVGVWQLTEGTVTDSEEDEVFIVLTGTAIVEFEGTDEVLELHPGVIGRLAAGSRTRWTVTETLRKVYLSVAAG
jgi:uncharacterized cupin superfamily protein